MTDLISQHLDLWTSAIAGKSSAGRGNTTPSPTYPVGHKGEGRGEGNPTSTRNAKYTAFGIKKLRELILELAVRGKLVPQDSNDEPAKYLLDKIYLQKTRLIDEGKLKPQKAIPKISKAEIRPHLPTGWELVRLGDVINVINGRAYKKHEMLQEGTPLLRVGNLFTSNEWYYSNLELEPDKYIDNGDLIYAWSASFGPFIWQGGKAIFHYHIWKLDLYDPSCLDKQFLFYFFTSITEKIKASGNGIAMIHMTKERMEKLILEIPPLAEQHRIVAKVNELMALCDQLEQQQTDSIAAHQTLVQTLLDTLTQAADAAEFEQAWSRIADQFDTLFTTESSIDQLKQTLLQLAVMGKLVPQDPNDEPASELLKKINFETEGVTHNRNTRQEKTLLEIGEDEISYDLPNGWEWVRLGQIINISSGDGLTSSMMNRNGQIPVYGGNGVTGYHDKENLTKPTLVIGRVGYYCGSIHVTPEKAWVTDNAFVTSFSEQNIHLSFLYWLLKGTNLKENENATAQPVISGRKIYPIVVGLPPLNEQHRIVAKVDELMALCDSLKARIAAAQNTQLQLADAIVEQAVA